MARSTLKEDKKTPETRSQKPDKKSSPKPQALNPSSETQHLTPDTEDQFVQEELPADFWDRENVPVEAYGDEESVPTTIPSRNTSRGQAASPIKHPLFAELQSLFPGRVLRIETTKSENKTGDDSKDETEPSVQNEPSMDESETDGE